MIFVKLLKVDLPATVTNRRSHVAKGLVKDLIKNTKRWQIFRLEFVSKVSYRYKKNDMQHTYRHIVVKQLAKHLIVVIILKNFNKRELHCLIKKSGSMYNIRYRCIIIVARETMRITYSMCVSVALVNHHAMHIHRIVICGMSGSRTFFHFDLINDTIFEIKKRYWT